MRGSCYSSLLHQAGGSRRRAAVAARGVYFLHDLIVLWISISDFIGVYIIRQLSDLSPSDRSCPANYRAHKVWDTHCY